MPLFNQLRERAATIPTAIFLPPDPVISEWLKKQANLEGSLSAVLRRAMQWAAKQRIWPAVQSMPPLLRECRKTSVRLNDNERSYLESLSRERRCGYSDLIVAALLAWRLRSNR